MQRKVDSPASGSPGTDTHQPSLVPRLSDLFNASFLACVEKIGEPGHEATPACVRTRILIRDEDEY